VLGDVTLVIDLTPGGGCTCPGRRVDYFDMTLTNVTLGHVYRIDPISRTFRARERRLTRRQERLRNGVAPNSPDVLRDSQSLAVDAPKLTYLDPAQGRPPTKPRVEILVTDRPLLCQFVDGHRCKIVRQLLHVPVISPLVGRGNHSFVLLVS
jgi:hypothetical protein